MNQEDFEAKFTRRTARPPGAVCSFGRVLKTLRCGTMFHWALSFLPILQWLPKYRWKTDLQGDIIGGLTVGIMHVPQGMAYASLASLPPVYGLYSSFFTSTVYMFFGTSRHVSIGVFAVASMMVGAVRLRFVPDPDMVTEIVNGTLVERIVPVKGPVDFGHPVTPLMLTSALAFAVGIVQLSMGVLRLGFLTTYMSDALVSGFTTGAACHVLTAQLNKVLGVKLPRYGGTGMLFLMIRDLILALPKANFVSIALSAFGITFLLCGKEFVNPWVNKRSPVPLPLELILVVIATIFSVVLNLKGRYKVSIVDHIPQGIPVPEVPDLKILPALIADAVGIAIVSYMFVISMAKLFAKKRKYKIDPGQELYAVGFMSSLSSFFPVYPAGASLSRSAVCEQSGANTQLYTLFSSALLLTVIVWLGPLLQPLPMCILGCIVIVSLKSLFMQCAELPRLWRISKFDFMVWLVCCIATLANDVMTGLTISVAFTLFSVVLRQQWPKVSRLTRSPLDGVYRPRNRYLGLLSLPSHIKIVRFEAPLSFVNVNSFLATVYEAMRAESPRENVVVNASLKTNGVKEEQGNGRTYEELSQKDESAADTQKVSVSATPSKVVIVDCGAISTLDSMGVDAFKEIYTEGAKMNVEIYFADVSESVLDVLEQISFFATVPKSTFFPTVHLAALSASSA